ncbi:MAG: sialidase family protein [Thermomicrobiales bacterium]
MTWRQRARGYYVGVPLALLLTLGILITARPATANEDNLSLYGQTTQQSLGINPSGTRICAVWTQFDVPNPQTYLRIYDTGAQSWSPPLSGPAMQVSDVGNVNRPRCAIDSAGNTHVVWQQKHRDSNGNPTGQLDVAYRRLAPNGNPTNGADWSAITIIEQDRSAADIDAFEPAPNGKVWLVYRQFRDHAASLLMIRSWTPQSSWSAPKVIAPGGDADAPRVGVDNQGYVHVIFRNGGASGISYVSLDPNGNVGPQLSVPNGAQAGAADIAVDRGNGDVHVVFAKDFTHLFYAKKSRDGGFSLTEIANGSQLVDEPSIAWSANGQLLVVYTNNKGSEVDIQASTDAGQHWTAPQVLTAPARGVSSPWLVMDRNGTGYVAYNRRDGGNVFFVTASAGSLAAPPPPPSAAPPTAPAPPDVPEAPTPLCFAETGHCIRGLFLAYWQEHGGLALNGYPLTDERVEVLADGNAYTVQYFERTRLEYHPENQPPYNVLLGQFGRRIHPADPPAAPRSGAYYFNETGHNLGGDFLAYWQENGGLELFGYPISEEFVQTLENGQPYLVQYFERARFEYHLENAGTPYAVELGQFGRAILASENR